MISTPDFALPNSRPNSATTRGRSPRSIRPARSILDRCRLVRFFRGAVVRAYRVTADAHALGRIFLHPICGTGRDRLALITRMDTQWRVGGGNPWYGLLPPHRLSAAGPLSVCLFR